MKINIKLLMLLASTTLLFGCGNKWLGAIGPEDGTLPPTIMYESEVAINNAFTGTYDLLKEYYGGNHVTVGYRSYHVGLCYMANDLVSNPSQWWTYEASWDVQLTGERSGYQTKFYWDLFYKVINNANAIIEGIEKNSPVSIPDSFKAASIAEAKALRGWAMHQMARVYQKNYGMVADKNVKCLPIYTIPASATNKGAEFSSVEKVYAQILEDLSDANIALMPASHGSLTYRANKNVAYAWRAQLRQEMGNNWEGAEKDAKAAQAGHPLMSQAEFKSGFNKFNNEWIWGVPFQDDQAQGYASFFSFADMTAGRAGYQTYFVNDELTKLFSATDCRVQWRPFAVSPPMQWASTKFRAVPGTFVNGDYVYIRSAEMLLIEAEALARQGSFGSAADLLYSLQVARDANAVKSGNTGDALLDEIYVESRKELFGEVPVEYIHCVRFGLPMVRNGSQTYNRTIPANDSRWLMQIPGGEVDNNPLWKAEYQNKR